MYLVLALSVLLLMKFWVAVVSLTICVCVCAQHEAHAVLQERQGKQRQPGSLAEFEDRIHQQWVAVKQLAQVTVAEALQPAGLKGTGVAG